MNCLICDKDLRNGATLKNLLFDSDLICFECRRNVSYSPKEISIGKYKIYSLYIYDENFSSLLLQYKECYDEALSDVFLFPHLNRLKKKYKGYSVVLAPSSAENLKRRGFNHLLLIFKSLGLPVIDCLYKDADLNQNNLSTIQRKNILDHIYIKDVALPDKVLLVDDVLTSGATITGCLNCLAPKVKNIEVLIIAYNSSYLHT